MRVCTSNPSWGHFYFKCVLDLQVLDEEETVVSFCLSLKRQTAIHPSPPAYKKQRGPIKGLKGSVR